jgi:hypothetical protein
LYNSKVAPTDCAKPNKSVDSFSILVFMGKSKDDIWGKFVESCRQGDAKSNYSKCSARDEPVIAAAARMRDHRAKCEKRLRAIGQLDEDLQPSRKSTVASSIEVGPNLYSTVWYY